ncbi:MAG TPA: hypothetical protein VN515_01340 [Terriglobales bacterium]|nr:hypothetical protein [Terriglobales bacterium]
MTIEEMMRASQVRTAENGFVYAVLAEPGEPETEDERGLARLAAAVPRTLVPRLGRAGCYFVPWLVKVRRSVAIATQAAPEGETRKELCHHLDVKPSGNLLLISLRFYEHDSYGLAMEFFDKVAYLATLDDDERADFPDLLRKEVAQSAGGELTPEAWEWRQGLGKDASESAAVTGARWTSYRRAAETDALGLYMAALYTDVFYEDLFEQEPGFPPLPPDQVYERMRTVERLFPPNRGYSLQMVRQRPRRRRSAAQNN